MLKQIYFIVACASLMPCQAGDAKQAADDTYRNAMKAFRARDLAASAQLCDQALAIDPKNADALILRGSVHVEKREFPAARKLFAEALAVKPRENTIVFNLAEIDYVEGNWAAAEKSFKDILNGEIAGPSIKPLIRFKLMVIALKMNDPQAAETLRDGFEKEGMQKELDFAAVLVRIHDRHPAEKEARALWESLQPKYPDGAPYIDSLIEAYYPPAAK